MAETFVNVTEGSGKKLHGWDRTIGANTVIDEFMLPGEFPLAAYTVTTGLVSGATSSDDVLQIMAGASLNVRLRRIWIQQTTAMTTAAEFAVNLIRLTSAGTGGTGITPSKLDNADAAAGATAMSGVPTATKGTAGVTIATLRFWGIQTAGTAGMSEDGPFAEWTQNPNSKGLIIPAGTANGLALRIQTGRAAIQVWAYAEFVETSFV